MSHQPNQKNQQYLLPDKRMISHYRVAENNFWRGFFLGFFSSIYGDSEPKDRRYPENPFFEDQVRIGADMYRAFGMTLENARESKTR